MKRLIMLIGITIWLLGCTAETNPPAPQTTDQPIENTGALATVAVPAVTGPQTAVSAETVNTPTPPEKNDPSGTDEITQSQAVSPVTVDLSQITPQPPVNVTPREMPGPRFPGETDAIVNSVTADLAVRLAIDPQEINVKQIEELVWNDGSLGCPDPNNAYITVLTSGFRLTLVANGQTYDYHASDKGNFVLCGPDGRPVPQP